MPSINPSLLNGRNRLAVLGILGALVLIGMVVAPQLWVQWQLRRHAGERPEFPGTGGEFAHHLVEHFQLTGVTVEPTQQGDHYDPVTRTVRLSQGNYERASLTSVAVAAHEVGHAIQHHNGERGLTWRGRLVSIASVTDRIASVFFLAAPVLGVLARTPILILGMVMIGVSLLAVRVLVHLVTLPVEFDASFGKALPILREGSYLEDEDLSAANRVLKAAAFTYVAAAIMSLVDIARWIKILR